MKVNEIPVEVFAQTMQATRRARNKTALIIGFDGGAALLQHSRPALVMNDLRGAEPTRGERDYSRTGDYWSRLGTSEARMQFLKRHTSTQESSLPDKRAIVRLAAMLEQNYLQAIVVTDPTRVLFDALENEGAMMRSLDAVGADPNFVKLLGSETKPILLDAGELLLSGFQPDRLEHTSEQQQRLTSALATFLAGFSQVYCWGWCQLNIPIHFIDRGLTRPVYLIGEYSECAGMTSVNGGYQLVTTGRNDETEATTEVFEKLAALLDLPAAGRNNGSAGPVVASDANPVRASNRPLLTQDTLQQLSELVSQESLVVVCIDGERTRQETAAWLATELERSGRTVRIRSGADVLAMGRWIGLQTRQPEVVLIGEVDDIPAANGSAPTEFQGLLQWWSRKLQTSKAHIAVLCPSSLAPSVTREAADPGALRSLRIPDYLTDDATADWLLDQLGDLIEPDAIYDLAQAMNRDPTGELRPVEWMCDALDLLCQEVLTATEKQMGDVPGRAAEDARLEAHTVLDMWNHIVRQMAEATTEVLPFDIRPAARLGGDVQPVGVPLTRRPDEGFDLTFVPRTDDEDDGPGHLPAPPDGS